MRESNEPVRGSCVCGSVHYELTPPFRHIQYCHCSRCRKATGSAHAANIFVKVEQFAWTEGADLVKSYELPSATWWGTAFCTACGSTLPWKTRNGKLMVVGAGTLDDDPGIRPLRNVYFGSRAEWYISSSELETFDTHPSG